MPSWYGTVVLELIGGRRKRFRSGRWAIESGHLKVFDGEDNLLLTKPFSEAKETLATYPNSGVKVTVRFRNGDYSSICRADSGGPSVVAEICAVTDAFRRKQQPQQEVDSDVKPVITNTVMMTAPANKQRMMKYFEGKVDNCHIASGMDVENEIQQPIAASEVVLAVASPVLAAQFEQEKNANSANIVVRDFDLETVSSAIRFCHTLTLADDDDTTSLINFAKRYEMDSLRTACSDRLQLIRSGLPITTIQSANKQRMLKHFEGKGGNCQIVSRVQLEENEMQEMHFPALEVVLTLASPVLAAEFEQEKNTDGVSIVIPNFGRKTVYSAIRFCHTLMLADDDDADSLLYFADRYKITSLHNACSGRLKTQRPTTIVEDPKEGTDKEQPKNTEAELTALQPINIEHAINMLQLNGEGRTVEDESDATLTEEIRPLQHDQQGGVLSSLSFDYPVLFRERPYIYVVDDKCCDNTCRCHYCLKSVQNETTALLRCVGCRFARYCDGRCQRAAWPDHRGECALLKKMGDGDFPSTFPRLIARLWLKRQKPFTPDERLPKELQQRRPSDIPTHFDHIQKDQKQMTGFEHMWIELQEYIGSALEKDEAFDLYAKLTKYLIPVICPDADVCGWALYIGVTGLKFSCDPDAFTVTDGVDLVVRAVKPGVDVEEPTQLTRDYLGALSHGLWTTSERRAHLAQCGQQCHCKMCLDLHRDAEMRSMSCQRCTASVPVADDPQKKTANCPKCGFQNDVAEVVELMKTIEALLNKWVEMLELKASNPVQFDLKMKKVLDLYYGRVSALLSPLNAYAARLIDSICLITNGKEETEFLLQSFPAYQRFVPCYHLEYGLKAIDAGRHFITIGNLAKIKEGIELLLQAAQIGKLHGLKGVEHMCRSLATEALEKISTE